MFYVAIKLKSGNWVTVFGCKTFEKAEKYATMYCDNNEWKIYEK